MHSMTQEKEPLVIGGVDAHADTHHFAALDQRGALLATESFPTTTPGYAQALDWLVSFGEIDRGHEKLPIGGHLVPHPSDGGLTIRCSCAVDRREDVHEEREDSGGADRFV